MRRYYEPQAIYFVILTTTLPAAQVDAPMPRVPMLIAYRRIIDGGSRWRRTQRASSSH